MTPKYDEYFKWKKFEKTVEERISFSSTHFSEVVIRPLVVAALLLPRKKNTLISENDGGKRRVLACRPFKFFSSLLALDYIPTIYSLSSLT